ncbi:MAG TPA: MipA/OmpV family protein [Myxococcales bacterium]|nr:MipA/OmpV family protein [Myxococcales bacterium]
MSKRFLVLAPLLCAVPLAATAEGSPEATAVAAPQAPVIPDWSVTVGAGALAVPAYPGASSTRVLPLPYLDIRYRDLFFLNPVAGVGINAISTRRLQLGVSVLPDLGRSASSGDQLRGWGDVGAGANLRVFGRYTLGPISILADARRQLGAGNGTLVDGGVTRTFLLSRHLILIPTATLTWANARYMNAYFGVDGNQSAIAGSQGQALPTYAPGAGLRDAALMLLAIVPLDDRWSVQSIVRAEVLLGDAASSPITQQRIQPMFGGFLGYQL